jgi:hypothetical protein
VSALHKLISVPLLMQELTLNHPNMVNAKKNTELLYSSPTFLASHT